MKNESQLKNMVNKDYFQPLSICDVAKHMVLKHFLLIFILFFFSQAIQIKISNIDKQIEISPKIEAQLTKNPNNTPVNNDINVFIFIATTSGLVLAGAISGYFSFSYAHTIKSKANKYSFIHILVGHLATGLALFVIGILLLVTVACLDSYTYSSLLSPWSLIMAVTLYFSMVCYDIYDFTNLMEENAT